MEKKFNKPMLIYISGPYSAPAGDTQREKVEENIRNANEKAIQIAKKGHLPFVPHTMMDKWEDNNQLGRDKAMEICLKWVEQCDALFFIAESPGAMAERNLAIQLNKPVYREIVDIPTITLEPPKSLSDTAINAYLTEYQECMDSYRHGYATIWQAGGIFTAISAAVLALSKDTSLASWKLQTLAPIAFLFWWIGIFIPIDRYGEVRRSRLAEIENLLSDPTIPGLNMQHFRKVNEVRDEPKLKRLIYFKPRVKEVVTIFGLIILLYEGHMVWKHFDLIINSFFK